MMLLEGLLRTTLFVQAHIQNLNIFVSRDSLLFYLVIFEERVDHVQAETLLFQNIKSYNHVTKILQKINTIVWQKFVLCVLKLSVFYSETEEPLLSQFFTA
jgi:hypothetical protein